MVEEKSGTRGTPGATRGGSQGAVAAVVSLVALVAVGLLALWSGREAWLVLHHPGPATLDEAVAVVALAAFAALGGWLVLSTMVAVTAHLPGRVGAAARGWAHRWTPALARRAAAVLVGAAIGTAMVPGVAAAGNPTPERVPGFAVTLSPPAPDGHFPGWTPSRPVHSSAPVARLVTGTSRPQPAGVVVHRGDSLWSIARRHLGRGATDAEVAAAWPSWYAANRAVVGPDPGLLHPGQVLRAPAPGELPDHPERAHR